MLCNVGVCSAPAHCRDIGECFSKGQDAPIPMILHCPRCTFQHVDKADPEMGWFNPVHRSHQCKACGTIWRPADVPTVGVANILTKGKADTWTSKIKG